MQARRDRKQKSLSFRPKLRRASGRSASAPVEMTVFECGSAAVSLRHFTPRFTPARDGTAPLRNTRVYFPASTGVAFPFPTAFSLALVCGLSFTVNPKSPAFFGLLR